LLMGWSALTEIISFVIQIGGVAFDLVLLMPGIVLGTVVNGSFFSVAAGSKRSIILKAC
jgi:hypothetical protein